MPRASRNRWTDAEVALLRGAAGAVATAAAGVLVIELLHGPTLALSVAAAAAGLTSVAVAVGIHQVRRRARSERLLALASGYPLVIALIASTLATVLPPPSIVSLGTLLAVMVAGLLSPSRVGLATLTVHVVTEVAGAVLAGTDPRWTLTSVVVGAAVYWSTRSAMRSLRDAVADAEELAAMREDFVATVSHELRTPVHVVAGIVETLATNADVLDPSVATHLRERLATRTHELRGLVDGLLDFSRLRGGHVQATPEPLDLMAVCSLSVERASGLSPDHALSVDGPSDAVALADPFLLPRVLDNLVTNACVHTPPGTTVNVAVDRVGDDLRVAVRDDGPGIDRRDLPNLRRGFSRGGDHLRRSSGGVGLGLAYCQEVLTLHDRDLEVASDQDGGACFSFRLPAADAVGASTT